MIFDKKRSQKESESTNDRSTLMLKMVTSYSIFLLIILILFFYLYQSTLNNACDLYNVQNESTLMSNVELFENDLTIMEVFCRQLLQNDDFRKIMNKSEINEDFIVRGNRVQTTLATDIYAETLLPITEAYCYLSNSEHMITFSHFTLADRYYNWIKKYPAEKQDLWMKYLREKEYCNRFLSMEQFTPLYSRDYFMYVIDLEDLFYMDANAKVCFVLEQNELAELFDCVQSENDSDFFLAINEDGVPFLSLGMNQRFTAEEIASLDFKDNFAPYRLSGKASTIGKYISNNTGYVYYYSFPAFETTSSIAIHRATFLLMFLVAFLSGGAMIFIFSRRNVQPIIELGQELHEAVEAQNYLQEVVDSQRPIICTSYVRQLLSGTITSEEEASYISQYLNLPEEASYYNVLHVVIYNNFEDSQESTPMVLNTPEDLQEIIANALRNHFGVPLYYFSPSERTYSVLLHCNANDEKNFILKISNIILKLHDYLLDTYDIWMFAGIGRNTNSLMNVWESGQQAVEAVSYTTKNYIFFPYEFIKKNSNAFYYPPEISTKLIHFITAGNTAQVLELFNMIHQENIEERSLPINLLKYLLSDIRNSLLKARFALPSTVDAESVKLLDERFNEHLSFKLLEDLALTLCKLFTTESDDNTLASTIEKYISTNYKDPSLGLNKISDEFQISETYFSHMFKEKTGVNFSTYLENIRMSEAARLIRETDISLNELYIAVGYNNSNTFRRAFKKVYGITPSSMRDNK